MYVWLTIRQVMTWRSKLISHLHNPVEDYNPWSNFAKTVDSTFCSNLRAFPTNQCILQKYNSFSSIRVTPFQLHLAQESAYCLNYVNRHITNYELFVINVMPWLQTRSLAVSQTNLNHDYHLPTSTTISFLSPRSWWKSWWSLSIYPRTLLFPFVFGFSFGVPRRRGFQFLRLIGFFILVVILYIILRVRLIIAIDVGTFHSPGCIIGDWGKGDFGSPRSTSRFGLLGLHRLAYMWLLLLRF